MFYSSPRFFITHKGNKALTERIYSGLVLAFKDGSLEKLINKTFFREFIKEDLLNRYFFELESEHIKGIDERYFQWRKILRPPIYRRKQLK